MDLRPKVEPLKLEPLSPVVEPLTNTVRFTARVEDEEKDDAANDKAEAAPVSNMYRALVTGVIREAFEKDSDKVGDLAAGEVITALGRQKNDDGQLRIQFERGWVSMISASGKDLLEEVSAKDEGQDGAQTEVDSDEVVLENPLRPTVRAGDGASAGLRNTPLAKAKVQGGLFLCSECGTSKAREGYSKKQASKPPAKRRCKACVSAAAEEKPAAPEPAAAEPEAVEPEATPAGPVSSLPEQHFH